MKKTLSLILIFLVTTFAEESINNTGKEEGTKKENTIDCYPPCRTGFVCYNGQCVSECNPPCPQGTICSGKDCVPANPPLKVSSSLKNPYEKRGGKIGVWGTAHIIGVGLSIADEDESSRIAGAVIALIACPFLISGIVETVRCAKWEQEHKIGL